MPSPGRPRGTAIPVKPSVRPADDDAPKAAPDSADSPAPPAADTDVAVAPGVIASGTPSHRRQGC
jgi:hypothetical protein